MVSDFSLLLIRDRRSAIMGRLSCFRSGGKFSIDLPTGTYRVVRFDPATGERQSLPNVPGGQPVTFVLPDKDWVLQLTNRK